MTFKYFRGRWVDRILATASPGGLPGSDVRFDALTCIAPAFGPLPYCYVRNFRQ
jgi:hypothetical protein